MTGTAVFDKSVDAFPIRNHHVFLASCVVSPLYSGGLERLIEVAQEQAERGSLVLGHYHESLDALRRTAARLLETVPENLSFQRNTSEAISMIALGYPFEPGDQVIGYVHEYPSNHYPWRNLERRGVEFVQLENVSTPGNEHCGQRVCAFSTEELEARITDRTRIIALSHVQFASGFALDLDGIAELCRERRIDFVVDAAQSLGSIPLSPDKLGISALASAGWKWLLGPTGSGLMYTSPEFRRKLQHVMVGAELMEQTDYLDHSWAPRETAKRFEYSTSSLALVGALEACITEVHLRYGVEALRDEILRLQDLFLGLVDTKLYTPVRFTGIHRSGILALDCRRRDPEELARDLLDRGFICSVRGGYLRFAPHFYVTDEEIVRFAKTLNRLGS